MALMGPFLAEIIGGQGRPGNGPGTEPFPQFI